MKSRAGKFFWRVMLFVWFGVWIFTEFQAGPRAEWVREGFRERDTRITETRREMNSQLEAIYRLEEAVRELREEYAELRRDLYSGWTKQPPVKK